MKQIEVKAKEETLNESVFIHLNTQKVPHMFAFSS